jgi:hypothetical protein
MKFRGNHPEDTAEMRERLQAFTIFCGHQIRGGAIEIFAPILLCSGRDIRHDLIALVLDPELVKIVRDLGPIVHDPACQDSHEHDKKADLT